jgi:K+-transporting ATPase KdpF subunit
LCRDFPGPVHLDDLADKRPGQDDGGGIMSAIYLVSAVVSAGLLVYLVVALLKPEWF